MTANYICHVCGGLVDRIGLQPRDVKLCDCKATIGKLRKRLAEAEAEVGWLRAEAEHDGNLMAGRLARIAELEAEVERLREAIDMTHACRVCPERTDNPGLRAELERLQAEVKRLRDENQKLTDDLAWADQQFWS